MKFSEAARRLIAQGGHLSYADCRMLLEYYISLWSVLPKGSNEHHCHHVPWWVAALYGSNTVLHAAKVGLPGRRLVRLSHHYTPIFIIKCTHAVPCQKYALSSFFFRPTPYGFRQVVKQAGKPFADFNSAN